MIIEFREAGMSMKFNLKYICSKFGQTEVVYEYNRKKVVKCITLRQLKRILTYIIDNIKWQSDEDITEVACYIHEHNKEVFKLWKDICRKKGVDY